MGPWKFRRQQPWGKLPETESQFWMKHKKDGGRWKVERIVWWRQDMYLFWRYVSRFFCPTNSVLLLYTTEVDQNSRPVIKLVKKSRSSSVTMWLDWNMVILVWKLEWKSMRSMHFSFVNLAVTHGLFSVHGRQIGLRRQSFLVFWSKYTLGGRSRTWSHLRSVFWSTFQVCKKNRGGVELVWKGNS